jgi:hypothetical protein
MVSSRRQFAADTTALPLLGELSRSVITARSGRQVGGSLESNAEPRVRSTLRV